MGSDAPVVRTRRGAVRGSAAAGVAAFKGIAYAAPPFGQRRFAAPQPAAAWAGVRDATRYGPTAPHAGYAPPYDTLLPDPIIAGEDCLNLNVWTPDRADGAGLPVMVFIHGGAFVNGSGAVPTYDGGAFARDGVVCVTLNYRIGAEGFAHLEGAVDNRGLLDQIAALEWVRDEIASFGGDPGAVTVFGESAGAMSIGALLSAPRARGLFRRAILQSGAGHHAISPATARLVAGELAARLGIEPTAAALAGVPGAALLEAQSAVVQDAQLNPDPARWGEVAANAMAFEPVVDGDLLPDLPIRRVAAAGGAPDVDILTGTTAEEHRLFLVPNGIVDRIDDAALAAIAGLYGLDAPAAVAAYRRRRPDGTPGELLADLMSDWFFRIPAVRLAEAVSGAAAGGGAGSGAPADGASAARAWMYEFAWRSPQLGGRLGSCHALELGFVFDALQQEWTKPLAGEHPPQALADDMHAAWVRFATEGDPGWAAYDAQRRAVMTFGEPSRVVEDPRAEERALWDGRR